MALTIALISCSRAPAERDRSGAPPEEAVKVVSQDRGEARIVATVELDIFSGRPNPTWNLSEEQTRALMALIEELPPGTPQAESPQGLGYRGFKVSLALADIGPTTVRVHRGEVRYGPEEASVRRLDAGKRLERWLLATAREVLDPQTYELVSREVQSDERQE